MATALVLVLVLAFWGLLWAGAVWVGPDTRDGRDWSERDPLTGRPRRRSD